MASEVKGTLFATREAARASAGTGAYYLGVPLDGEGTAPVCAVVRSGPGSVATACAPGDAFAGIVTTVDSDGRAPLVAASGLDDGTLALAPGVDHLCQPSQLSVTWAAGVCRLGDPAR